MQRPAQPIEMRPVQIYVHNLSGFVMILRSGCREYKMIFKFYSIKWFNFKLINYTYTIANLKGKWFS